MKNLIEILPNIYGVKVPFNSNDFDESDNYLIFDPNPFDEHQLYVNENIGFNFKILGTITATEISFDASEVVKSVKGCKRYLDYSNKEISKRYFNNAEFSFRSALPKEIYFENPIKLLYNIEYMKSHKMYHKEVIEYQTAQQNITEKLLILQKL